METMKRSPEWKEAVSQIVKRVKEEGYGILISHDQILVWLDLEEPTSVEGYKHFSLLRLSYTEQVKEELLTEHCIYLMNDRGVGYKVLTPDEQVKQAPQAHMKKAATQMRKATESCTHVDSSKLSAEASETRKHNLAKLGFLAATMGSRRMKLLA